MVTEATIALQAASTNALRVTRVKTGESETEYAPPLSPDQLRKQYLHLLRSPAAQQCPDYPTLAALIGAAPARGYGVPMLAQPTRGRC
jgi:hypothetical protein